MNQIIERCVSLGTGALSPDLRVNYEFGLVLGVDEFRQEQLYHLEKNYLHHRALHGYGTVYGLRVTTDPPSATEPPVLITVQPGLGVDQWGRPFLLRTAQCARLDAWLAQQSAAEVEARVDPSGVASVYVVASYDECPDALVPLAGEPCATSEQMQAPSRIRDSFRLELRWDPPPMPAWAAALGLADVLTQVLIDPSAPQSDEDALISLLRTLATALDGAADATQVVRQVLGSVSGQTFRLPAATAREALDRIFVVWVTEVRPLLPPDLSDPRSDPAGDPAILLTRVDFIPDLPFVGEQRPILDVLPPDDEGRPYLLHTQLIQELLLLGGSEGGPVALPQQEFITIDTSGDLGSANLQLWFHTTPRLTLPNALSVLRSSTNALASFTATPVPAAPSHRWQLVPTQGGPLQDGELLTFAFDTSAIQVEGGGTLAARIAQDRLAFVGHDGLQTIRAFHIADLTAPAPPPPPPPEPGPVLPFVTITPQPDVREPVPNPDFELWFHLDRDPSTIEMTVLDNRPPFEVFAEIRTHNIGEIVPIGVQTITRTHRNAFRVLLNPNEWNNPDRAAGSRYLRFVFSLEMRVGRTGNAMTLRDYIEQTRTRFEGHNERAIVAYVRVPGPGGNQ